MHPVEGLLFDEAAEDGGAPTEDVLPQIKKATNVAPLLVLIMNAVTTQLDSALD